MCRWTEQGREHHADVQNTFYALRFLNLPNGVLQSKEYVNRDKGNFTDIQHSGTQCVRAKDYAAKLALLCEDVNLNYVLRADE